MFFGGQVPPWLQGQQNGMGAGGGGAAPMTAGSGMPPYGQNAPMNMQPRQMQPGGALPSQGPPPQQGQQPMNPMQMGMLAQMLAQQTKKPGDPAGLPPWSQISPKAMEGVIPGQSGADTRSQMVGMSPDSGIMGILQQLGLFR